MWWDLWSSSALKSFQMVFVVIQKRPAKPGCHSFLVSKGEEYFNEYTIYYHAMTTHGHPGTCALFKYTEETPKRQQLQAGIHG